jgi:hypothetical protein
MPLVWAPVYLSAFIGLQFGGDTPTCLGRTGFGATVGLEHRAVHVEGELATTVGVAPLQVVTALTNISVGSKTGPLRPYVLAGVGEMAAVSPTGAETGRAWDVGAGVEAARGDLGVRVDVRYVSGPFAFGRVTAGLVLSRNHQRRTE